MGMTLVLPLVVLTALVSSLVPITNSGAGGVPHLLPAESAATGFSGSATWNGRAVATAGSPGSAISTSFGSSITVGFVWGATAGASAPSFGITDAILHVVYLGQNVWTKDQAFSPAMSAVSGQYNLSNDFTGSRYLVEGLFLIQLVLLSDSHGQVWSESFYVHVVASNHLTAATLALALLCVYEIVVLVRVGAEDLPATSPRPDPAPTSPPAKEAKK
ncbi:MAG TPA: hypothetical protein VJQ43_00625 [Thermoplasmata archaeon]|nr:hypothetical protein [Thermoplasmata archaeon]